MIWVGKSTFNWQDVGSYFSLLRRTFLHTIHDAVTTPVLPALGFLATPPGLLLYFLGSEFKVSIHIPSPRRPRSPHTFPRHATLIARPLAPFPEPTPGLFDKTRMANATILGSVVLFSRTVSTDHSIGVLVRMVSFGVMTLVAGEHL